MTRLSYLNTLKRKLTALIISLSFVAGAHASWVIQPDSSYVHFMSIKATHIGEVHSFSKLSGSVKDNGQATLQIDLASVDTLIPIRDERMRELLFEVEQHPTAVVDSTISIDAFQDMLIGTETQTQLDANLKFKTTNNQISAEVIVSRPKESTFIIQSTSPVLLSASNLQVTKGLEKLREIAGLPSISFAIPVSFRLTFEKD